jgi:putative ABC transport system permease protein
MGFLSILKQAFKAILSNKMRSFLTMLGIIIGIGAVIALMSLGTGVQESINEQVGSLGSRNIMVTSSNGFTDRLDSTDFSSAQERPQQATTAMMSNSQSLTKDDLNELNKISTDLVSYTAGYLSTQLILKNDDIEIFSTILGVSSEYFVLNDLKLSSGEFVTSESDMGIVLGSTLAENLFGDEDVIGQEIQIQEYIFTVNGILAEESENNISNPNLQAYISDTEAFNLLEKEFYNVIVVQASSDDVVEDVKDEIKRVLLSTHNINDEDATDFSITSSEDLLEAVDSITGMMTSFLSGIAGISLLVGGIGIMNIMLVSVTERTREIGLRKALGAKTSDILLQFMTESVVLTIIGGIFGIIVGYLIGYFVGDWLDINSLVTVDAVVLAVGISSVIGIVFGIYPAARAAKLNPIDALRYE